MDKILPIVGVVSLLLLGYGFITRAPPLPAELAKIECQKDSKYIAADDYEVFELADTQIALPCQKARSYANLVKDTKRFDPNAEVSFKMAFKKAPNGMFVRSDDASAIPYSSFAQYTVQAVVDLRDTGPLQLSQAYTVERTVPTPAAFATTGPKTTFVCTADYWWQKHPVCIASVRSKKMYWVIRVSIGKPVDRNFDPTPQLSEGYNLLAAHILKQK